MRCHQDWAMMENERPCLAIQGEGNRRNETGIGRPAERHC
jgi:hypothetical protein